MMSPEVPALMTLVATITRSGALSELTLERYELR